MRRYEIHVKEAAVQEAVKQVMAEILKWPSPFVGTWNFRQIKDGVYQGFYSQQYTELHDDTLIGRWRKVKFLVFVGPLGGFNPFRAWQFRAWEIAVVEGEEIREEDMFGYSLVYLINYDEYGNNPRLERIPLGFL